MNQRKLISAVDYAVLMEHAEMREDEVKKIKVWQALLCFLVFSAPNAFGAMPRDYQVWPSRADEFAKLPPYCTVRLKKGGASDPQFKALYSSMTSDFIHIHHYCAGLNVMNYYYRTTGTADKQRVLREAVKEFSYMVDKARPDWYMMPEIYASRGEAYLLSGNFGAGITDLNKAISLNPNLLKPYILLADHYQTIKQTQNALKITIDGLKQNPENKGLQRRYLSLGGKEPFPEPYKKVMGGEVPVAEKQESSASSKDSETADMTTSAQVPEPETATETKQSTPPEIGIPGNPYCRFCPDSAPTESPPSTHPGKP